MPQELFQRVFMAKYPRFLELNPNFPMHSGKYMGHFWAVNGGDTPYVLGRVLGRFLSGLD